MIFDQDAPLKSSNKYQHNNKDAIQPLYNHIRTLFFFLCVLILAG